MKILIVCSTSFYSKIEEIKNYLISKNIEVLLPNGYGEELLSEGLPEETFKNFYDESRKKVSEVDAILVLNYDKIKNGQTLKNYIGASTFLEMYEACMQDKKIFMMNDYPDNMLYEEIRGFNPIIINGNLDEVIK